MKRIKYADLPPDERARFDELRKKELAAKEIEMSLWRHGLLDAVLYRRERVTLMIDSIVVDVRARRQRPSRSPDDVHLVPNADD